MKNFGRFDCARCGRSWRGVTFCKLCNRNTSANTPSLIPVPNNNQIKNNNNNVSNGSSSHGNVENFVVGYDSSKPPPQRNVIVGGTNIADKQRSRFDVQDDDSGGPFSNIR